MSTSIIAFRQEQNSSALRAKNWQDNGGFDRIMEEVFSIDEKRHQKIKQRIGFKGLGTVRKISKDEEMEEQSTKKISSRILKKVSLPYSSEYIAIKRKSFITNMIEQINNMDKTLQDKVSLQITIGLFKNEINNIYKTFLQTGQDEHFLSLVNLLEDIICRNELDKKILKECKTSLKNIENKDIIEYSDYEKIVRRFFEIGVDVINLQEIHDEE